MELFSSKLAAVREESASVKKLQSTIQALEQDKAFLQEQIQRLERDLTAGPDDVNKASGNTGRNDKTLSYSCLLNPCVS